MGRIYHGSLLTIAASASSHSDGGCFNRYSRPRFSNDEQKPILRGPPIAHYTRSDMVCLESVLQNGSNSRLYIITGTSSPYSGTSDFLYSTEVDSGPLSYRAWVFQEQMLSRRILYYAKSQLFWECEHCRLSEDNWPQTQADRLYPVVAFEKPMSTSEVIEKWYRETVERYSARDLSHPTDKLVAISAAAEATYLNRNVEYLAGLWKDCIIEGLLWSRCSPGCKIRCYACPSWSWASQDTTVSYDYIRGYEGHGQSVNGSQIYDHWPKIIDAHTETEPETRFGDVKSGYIKLDTLVTSGWVMRYDAEDRVHARHREFIFSTPGRNDVWSSTAIMDDDDHQESKCTVAFLGLRFGGWIALLLKPVVGRERTYQRVGISVSQRHRHELVDYATLWVKSGIKPQCITIV
jgi:hypothetical protein